VVTPFLKDINEPREVALTPKNDELTISTVRDTVVVVENDIPPSVDELILYATIEFKSRVCVSPFR